MFEERKPQLHPEGFIQLWTETNADRLVEIWRIEVSKLWVKGTTRRHTELINMGPWGLTKSGPQTREHAGAELKHNVELGLPVSPLTRRETADWGYFLYYRIHFFLPVLSLRASLGEDMPNPAGARCLRVGLYTKELPLFEQKGRGKYGEKF